MSRPRKFALLILLSTAASAGGVGPLLAIGPAAAAPPTLEPAVSASPDLEVRAGRKECEAVPACQTVPSPLQNVPAGPPTMLELACPAGTYFWNWSAIVVPHVQIVLRGVRLDTEKHAIAATFEYFAQSGNGSGQAQVYLGCSAIPISAWVLKHRRFAYGWNPHE